MKHMHIGVDQPAEYEIRIQGRLDCEHNAAGGLADWFVNEARCAQVEDVTVLTGTVADQAALHGLLARIRDLGLALVYVECKTAGNIFD